MQSTEIKKILNFYSVFGIPVHLGRRFQTLYRCPGWLNPVMSPILTQKGQFPNPLELEKLGQYFKKIKTRKTPYDLSKPYFNVLTQNVSETKKLTAKAKSFGFEPLYSTQALCIFNQVRPFQLPDQSKVLMGEYFEPHLFQLMQSELKTNFNSTDLFLRELNQMIGLIRGKTYSVLIQNKKGLTMASGLFTLHQSHCVLWSGSVSKKWRGQRLSRVSLELRKSLSLAFGAKSWLYFTRNEQMKNYFDQRVLLDSFYKV